MSDRHNLENGEQKDYEHKHNGSLALLPQENQVEAKVPKTGMARATKIFNDNKLMILTIIGVVIGFVLGFGIRVVEPGDEAILWLSMPGDIFIRLLKMTILPLIAANVIVVTSSLDPKVNGKISMVAFGYIIVANVASAVLGMSCALIIKPGKLNLDNSNTATKVVSSLKTSDVFADLLYNIFPDNIVGACLFQSQTKYVSKQEESFQNFTEKLNDTKSAAEGLKRTVINNSGVNMIGVLFCSFIFGMAARLCGDDGIPFLRFFKSLADIVIRIMRWFLWLTPVGVCFMIAGSVAGVPDLAKTFSKLGLFVLTVTVGLGIHFVISNLVLLAASRSNPLVVVPKSFRSWFISFATTSPVVAIPEMYQCCDQLKIPETVSRFVIPFAAALKGDGSSVFISCAAIFIGQLAGDPLNPGSCVVIILLTASSMMALPNIPSASIVILVTVLSSVGIDSSHVGLLFAIEWLLDRMRSGTIGLSHIYCASFTYHICRADLFKKQQAELDVELEASLHNSVDKLNDKSVL